MTATRVRSSTLSLLPTYIHQTIRCAHQTLRDRPIPPPTPFVPNHETFLTLIGRNLKAHASKIPSWDALFTLSSTQLRDLGVEPARSRKYLLRWRERFRQGVYGIGGDLQHVTDGVGHVRVFEVPVPDSWNTATSTSSTPSNALATASRSAGMRKVALNVPHGALIPTIPPERAVPIQHLKIKGSHHISGKHVELLGGTDGMAAKISISEGLWEERRGHKVDGGERRKAEVRSKRRAAERKNARS